LEKIKFRPKRRGRKACCNLRSEEKFRQRAEGKIKWSERQDLNPSPATDSQALTKADAQRDSQTPVDPLHDLSQVVTAWAKLPAPLKAAILAIVNSAEGKP
jgi:hypothetical protein